MPVYFVAGAGLTKVGYTGSPEYRLRTLQGASPVALTLVRVLDGNDRDEVRLHRLLADFHSHGEWFRLSDEQVFADYGLREIVIPEADRTHLLKLRRHSGIAVRSHPYIGATGA